MEEPAAQASRITSLTCVRPDEMRLLSVEAIRQLCNSCPQIHHTHVDTDSTGSLSSGSASDSVERVQAPSSQITWMAQSGAGGRRGWILVGREAYQFGVGHLCSSESPNGEAAGQLRSVSSSSREA